MDHYNFKYIQSEKSPTSLQATDAHAFNRFFRQLPNHDVMSKLIRQRTTEKFPKLASQEVIGERLVHTMVDRLFDQLQRSTKTLLCQPKHCDEEELRSVTSSDNELGANKSKIELDPTVEAEMDKRIIPPIPSTTVEDTDGLCPYCDKTALSDILHHDK